jgi:DNA-directed RNA polymerase subunit beta'
MLRKVRVESGGDTGLLEGSVIDKFEFRAKNEQLTGCIKITDPGDTKFQEGDIVPQEIFEQQNAQFEADGGRPAKSERPRSATASTQLLGITKASVQSWSFLSAASFQETTKVLTEAALAGKVDNLVGLKENVILGHLVPAGTGFRSYQESEVRLRPLALSQIAEQRPSAAAPVFPLMEDGDMFGRPEGAAQGGSRPAPPTELDRLLGANAEPRVATRPDSERGLSAADDLPAPDGGDCPADAKDRGAEASDDSQPLPED